MPKACSCSSNWPLVSRLPERLVSDLVHNEQALVDMVATLLYHQYIGGQDAVGFYRVRRGAGIGTITAGILSAIAFYRRVGRWLTSQAVMDRYFLKAVYQF